MSPEKYQPKHKIRFVTAASLFDGHDAAINLMRRILQGSGAEVIHLGHNRSVQEIVDTAIQEDVQGIAISSYQGGHIEFFKYMHDLLQQQNAGYIKIFGGGGGVIVDAEIEELEAYGIAKIFSPEAGMQLGLQGMINYMLEQCDFDTEAHDAQLLAEPVAHTATSFRKLARHLTRVEQGVGKSLSVSAEGVLESPPAMTSDKDVPVVGITGTGGAGKSTLTDELVRRFMNDFPDLRMAVLSVDPSKRVTGGALLGDRIRMNAIYGKNAERVYMRSFATRQAHRATSQAMATSIEICKEAGFDVVILETAGIGQSDTEITELTDTSIYVMTHDFGAPTQLEKIGMLDVADFVVINKFEKRGSADALRDIRKQVQRNRGLFHLNPDQMPVYPTMASQFNDPGVTRLYLGLLERFNADYAFDRETAVYGGTLPEVNPNELAIIPPKRQRYLGEVVDTCREYRKKAEEAIAYARKWGEARGVLAQLDEWKAGDEGETRVRIEQMRDHWWNRLSARARRILKDWDVMAEKYTSDTFVYEVRGKRFTVPLYTTSLSGLKIPKVAIPRTQDAGERLRFALLENAPGFFPYTSGVFPFKRAGEDPTRMFAGEGSPERTNRRFHLVSLGMPARRLSTAFDSVTLYGFDPHTRPDIYGKVGNSGVSICTLDDMKKLYSGFDLCDKATSVSMTINGPAPMILALFMNTAIDQQVEFYLKEKGTWNTVAAAIAEKVNRDDVQYVPYGPQGPEEGLPEGHDGSGLGLLGTTGEELVRWGLLDADAYAEIKARTLSTVRGTVQADILKEDQAQNTCIFSTEFALRMMGDVQQYFIDHKVRNYYSVSISGYHIAEAGANPISQLAFTLANGLTFVEYYLSRGMDIDDFAANLSFFFSNGLDPEYTVIGRVARRIWAVVMRDKYGANERSQKLKYHIQTSGRSLHAKEIQFNDIRTTLQALIAIYDNCNSLHTNAFDEAITTPTEESVRRAMAIQLIINRELGLAKNENPNQGAFIIDELTDLVEEAVLTEFERINDRGGVLGAMETMYQRGKIQEESMLYEHKKHSGELPVIGVNTFLSKNGKHENEEAPVELMRSSTDEKQHQIDNLERVQRRHTEAAQAALNTLQEKARAGGNLFEALMDTVKVCSLGQITDALFEVGGQYRRNM
ncbi:MAG: methylmalonyl-CoA mutase family protein [Bacteroidota bacterium]